MQEGVTVNLRIALAAVLAASAISAPASAGMIVIDIERGCGSTENTGAAGRLTLDFSTNGSDDYLSILVENVTPALIGGRLTAVGLEYPDSLAAPTLQTPSSYFDELNLNVSIAPPGLDAPGGYDVLITSDMNFEGGSSMGAPGSAQTVVLNFGDTGLTSTELMDLFMNFYSGFSGRYAIARFQSLLNGGSDKVCGRLVPEPGTLALLALGAAAAIRRGRRA